MNKFDLVKEHVRSLHQEMGRQLRLLDVGCRDCKLKSYVDGLAAYEGVDLFQNSQGTVDHVQNVSRGLPFSDNTFDMVVALDLLEHLDDLQHGLDELLRVSRSTTLILLPNMAHIGYRLSFLRRGYLNEKYHLEYNQGLDRHRWLTIASQNERFVNEYAREYSLKASTLWFVDSAKKAAFGRLCCALGMGPDWWSIASVHLIRKSHVRNRSVP
jgi:SAM-dependent methyltransferase